MATRGRRAEKEPDLLDAVMAEVARTGLRDLDRAAVARRAGVSVAAVYDAFPTRASVLAALGRRLDRAMLDFPPEELDPLSPRERLFELIMRRLDAALPWRPALRRMVREMRGEPRFLLRSLCNLDRMAEWLLEVAGLPVAGARRLVLEAALLRVYVRTFDTWLRDESEDLARTLAALDRGLGRFFRIAERIATPRGEERPPRRRGAPPGAEAEGAAES